MTPNPRQRALDLLAQREHSTQELRRKLIDKGFEPSETEELLTRLTHDGLLNDERFVESFIQSRITKGFGPLHIQAHLRERGIAAPLITESVKINAQHWCQAAQQAQQKRFGLAGVRDYRERARQMRFLQQRGFTMEQINAAFKSEHD